MPSEDSYMRHSLLLAAIVAMIFLKGPAWGDEPAVSKDKGKKVPETSSKVTWVCPHIGKQKIQIDGKANEPAWKVAKPLENFTVLKTLKAPGWLTTAKIAYDDTNLYIAFDCKIDGIRSTATKRDDHVFDGEVAELFFCPRGADAFYYEIDFSPKNVVYDCRLESWKYEPQSKFADKWAAAFNATIESEAVIHENENGDVTGWAVEAAIPFKDLDIAERRTPPDGEVWLFNVFRGALLKDNKTYELQHWGPVKPEFHRPHQFPRLKFVRMP